MPLQVIPPDPELELEMEQNPVQAQDAPAVTSGKDTALVDAELLVEDVSIDGMCGVY